MNRHCNNGNEMEDIAGFDPTHLSTRVDISRNKNISNALNKTNMLGIHCNASKLKTPQQLVKECCCRHN